MWTLSAFGDEIGDDLELQLEVLRGEGIRHLELRKAWGTNVLDLTDGELGRVQALLAAAGVRVSAIGSPIGKIDIGDDFAPHLQRLARSLEVAAALQTPYIRIFSFRLPADSPPAAHRAEVLHRLGELLRQAEAAGAVLLLENEKRTYADTDERMADVFTSLPSPHLRGTFDPANFVQVGVQPFPQAYTRLQPHIAYLHLKDARFGTRTVMPVGEGDGALGELLRAARHDGYDGFLSLEPHLKKSPDYLHLDHPGQFRAAAEACRQLLDRLEIPWS